MALPSLPDQAERLVALGVHDLAGLAADDLRDLAASADGDGLLVTHAPPSALAPLLRHAGKPGFVVEDMTEVVEFYRMSGEVDYLLRVVVPDIAAYDAFYKKLIARINLTDVSSSFAMGQIKYTTALPLDFAIVADDDK